MKKINYKKLTIQNFLSVGNEAVVLDFQRGLNLITGKNIDNPERVNAVGKSTIVEAYYYSLFGKTLRDLKKEYITNNVTKGKGRVELDFDIEDKNGVNSYKIIRQVKPSKVELWKGEEDITRDSIGNTDSFIANLIGSNSIISKSCDILSLSDNIPFMNKNAAEKRKFVEDIFTLEVFSRMLKDLKEMIKENKSNLSISEAKIGEISNTIETLKRQEERYKKEVEERESNLLKKKSELESQIESVKKLVDGKELQSDGDIVVEKKKYEDVLDKIEAAISKKNSEKSSNSTLLKIKKDEIRKIESVGGAECDKCLQEIPHTHIDQLNEQKELKKDGISKLNDIVSALNEKISEFEGKKQKAKSKISQLGSKITEIKVENNQHKTNLDKLESLKGQFDDIMSDLEKTVESNDTFSESISETEKRKTDEQENYNSLNDEAEDLKVCSFVLGDEGVKSFVVKKLLKMLNGSIQQYINDLGMSIRCEFDEYFDEKMKNPKGKDICYQNLSGAERMTVDLACAWAFKDIKEKISGVSSNLEWNDEILDSKMDTVGFDKLVDVIKNRIDKSNLCVYAVSHRQELKKHIDGETVNLEMENYLTRRVVKDT